MDELSRYLSSPLDWGYIHCLNQDRHPEPVSKILPVRVLSKLPIAVHNAGVKLCSLRIYAIPKSDWRLLAPLPTQLSDHMGVSESGNESMSSVLAWDDLSAACRDLRTFHVCPDTLCDCGYDSYIYQDDDNSALVYMDTFLSCLVSSPGVKELRLGAAWPSFGSLQESGWSLG